MLFLEFILKNAFRHKLRAILTIVGAGLAIVAFGLLQSIVNAWVGGVENAAANRLMTRGALSMFTSLPEAYKAKIEAVPGVVLVTPEAFFGGYFQDERKRFPNFGVDPEVYLKLHPEFLAPEEQKKAFLADRRGAMAGRGLMKRFGWKLGDAVSLKTHMYSGDWTFVIRAVYEGANQDANEDLFVFHWDYIKQSLKKEGSSEAGRVGVFSVGIDDASRAAEIAKAIDDRFKNSPVETQTETEKAFFLKRVTDSEAIIFGVRVMSFLVIGVILAVTANAMGMSVRERMGEFAALKTLGFKGQAIAGFIFGESLLVSLLGCALGLCALPFLTDVLSGPLSEFFPPLRVGRETYLIGAGAGVFLGAASAALPAWRAASVRIAEGLRRIG